MFAFGRDCSGHHAKLNYLGPLRKTGDSPTLRWILGESVQYLGTMWQLHRCGHYRVTVERMDGFHEVLPAHHLIVIGMGFTRCIFPFGHCFVD